MKNKSESYVYQSCYTINLTVAASERTHNARQKYAGN